MANVLQLHYNIRVSLDEESFSQVLKGVQSEEDIHSEVVDQRIILAITVHDFLYHTALRQFRSDSSLHISRSK